MGVLDRAIVKALDLLPSVRELRTAQAKAETEAARAAGQVVAATSRAATAERLLTIKQAGDESALPALPRPAFTDVISKGHVKGLQRPDYDFVRLFAYYELEDTVRGVVDKLATTVTRKGDGVVPRYARKCATCGHEYEAEVEECDGCKGVTFLEPDPTAREVIARFFRDLNADVPTDSILEDTVRFAATLNNAWWWVRSESTGLADVPSRVDLLDSRFIWALTRPDTSLGSDAFFCPSCYWTTHLDDTTKVFTGTQFRGKPCLTCDGELAESAWVQVTRAGKVVGRWTKAELVHFKRETASFRLYATPKLATIAAMCETLLWQTRYLLSAFRDRRTFDGILTLPLGTEAGKEMLRQAKEEWARTPAAGSVLTLFTGNDANTPPGEAKWLNIMGKFADLSPLQFREAYVDSILALFGVGRVFRGEQQAGQLGHPEDALEASFDSVEGLQTHLEDTVNRFIVSRFPGGDGWRWEMTPPKARDEMLDWQVREKKVAVAAALNVLLAPMGKRVNVTEDWEVEFSDVSVADAEAGDEPTEDVDVEVPEDGETPTTPPATAAPGAPPAVEATATAPAAADVTLALTATDLATIVKVDEGRQSVGLSPIGGDVGGKWIREHAAELGSILPAEPGPGGPPAPGDEDDDEDEPPPPDGDEPPDDEEKPNDELPPPKSGPGRGTKTSRVRRLFAKFGRKSLTPRNTPAADAVFGVRDIEESYVAEVRRLYRDAFTEALADVGGHVESIGFGPALLARFAEAREEALILTWQMTVEAYAAAVREERASIPEARFEMVDASLAADLVAGRVEFYAAFSTFNFEAHDAILGVLVESMKTPAGFDLRAITAEMRTKTGGELWRLERIVRSEMTRVVNEARAKQWETYAPDPTAEEYEWVIADDGRVDETCQALADQNPWALEELRAETNGFIPHPNCRCTVVRRPSSTGGGGEVGE